MKKTQNKTQPNKPKRLLVSAEKIRNLSVDTLANVVGGCGPCTVTEWDNK